MIIEYTIDDFTPSGNLCYINENGEIFHQTPLQELFNLRWYIQHVIDESEGEFENHLSEENWMEQTNWKFIKYVIHHKQSMTPEQLKKKSLEKVIKIKQHEQLDTAEGESNKDEEESTTSSEMSEQDSESDTTADDTEETKPTETHQVNNVFHKSTHDEDHSYQDEHVIEIELPKENGEKRLYKRKTLYYQFAS